MAVTPPHHRRAARSVSNASSGERTVRPRRRSSAGASSNDRTPRNEDSEAKDVDDGDGVEERSPSQLPNHPAAMSEEEALVEAPVLFLPQWKEMSQKVLRAGDDPEEGPSDYWRRPSPALGPGLSSPARTASWLRTSESRTPTDVNDELDTTEYSRRLEQVLSLAHETPSPSPAKQRNYNSSGSPVDGEIGGGLWATQRSEDPLYSADEARASAMDEEEGQDEFGAIAPQPEATFIPHAASQSLSRTPSRTPSVTSTSFSVQEGLVPSRSSPSGPSRSFIHPSVSRLRSQPHTRSASTSTQLSVPPPPQRIPSHFSQISLSRSDSLSTVSLAGPSRGLLGESNEPHHTVADMGEQGPAFVFHPLRQLSTHLFNRLRDGEQSSTQQPASVSSPRKASSVLGLSMGGSSTPEVSPRAFGRPSVMDINGMIAVGTEGGWVVVYGFGQDVRHILGTDVSVSSGPVTAVTVCPDQTWIGVGHANGNVFLYDLANPSKPARSALALALPQVLSGRKEGHLQGSRVIHIGFVGKRHTSVVTADEHGRAFWFSLGRVMGVDSTDVVRMLGSYPEKERELRPPSVASPRPEDGSPIPGSVHSIPVTKRSTTLFAALPLPMGETVHATDAFHITALLTPVKLVVVGMKPTAKTWFRKMRDAGGGPCGAFVGAAAWLRPGEVVLGDAATQPSDPVLAYSWGTSVRFLRVRVGTTQPPPPKSGEKKSAPTSAPEFVEGRRWEAPHPIQSLHWYDPDHLLLITSQQILLLNVRSMTSVENTPLQVRLLTSQDFFASLQRRPDVDTIPKAIASSARTYRGKLFLLTKANVQVGTLQQWNDRVLANVHRGDFLAAINLALTYYQGKAAGNTVGLSEDPAQRQEVVGSRVRELMRASLEWAFSEDRMHDDTHFSADGRGVDLTALFEGLVTACIEACVAMGDEGFLFDTAYEYFVNAHIHGIFLSKLEGYLFEGRISELPPTIVQALIAYHDEREEYAVAEAVIWHVAPGTLDINQAVTLCEKRHLWDALIHVYTRAMGDYVAPIVKLVRVICDIQKHRRERPSLVGEDSDADDDEELLVPDAYKLYAYMANVLSGMWYPSGEPMVEPEATRARAAAYEMIFFDRNIVWPTGSDELVLTSPDMNSEPPYPYLRLLLRFDTEAFLHAMDIAFEDSFLNDPMATINRQSIINLMLDVMDEGFHSSDVTFLHIFVARNLPKYPQFIFIPPSTSHRILISLAADPDQSTREDRQLAAEYLLSAYTPHDADDMLAHFEQAGFFRILRAAYQRDRKWAALIDTFIKDPDTDESIYESMAQTIDASKDVLGVVPQEVVHGVEEAMPHLLALSVQRSARFIDNSLPILHDHAIDLLDGSDHKQAAYLRCLLDPSADEPGGEGEDAEPAVASTHMHTSARHKYVSLLARHEPTSIVPFLDAQGSEKFDLRELAEELESLGQPEGQLWALDRTGNRQETFGTVDSILATQGADLATAVHGGSDGDAHVALSTVTGVAHMAIRLCEEHTDGAVEDMWFGVLHSIIELVHSVAALGADSDDALRASTLETLRGVVQDALQALLSTSSPALSFARLFKRLVEATPRKDGARAYSEFRTILIGMLDSFRQDSDVLALSIRLVEADNFDLLEEKVNLSQAGWRPKAAACATCHKPLWRSATDSVALRADGSAVHVACC